MLKFLAQHAIQLANDNRDALFENPKTSAIWRDSPLSCLFAHELFRKHTYVTCMCAFSAEPDGRRSKKETKLVATFELKHSYRHCRCARGHIHLKGYDPEKHQIRTAAAAMYTRKFCVALCQDCKTTATNKHQSLTTTVYPVDDEDRRDEAYDDEPRLPPVPPADGDEAAAIEAPPPAPDTIYDELGKVNVDSVKFEPGPYIRLIDNNVDIHRLKACLLYMADYISRFAIPGLPSGRVFLRPDQASVPSYEPAKVLWFWNRSLFAVPWPAR